MKQDIKKKWIASIKEFAKKPRYLHLLFPMKLNSSEGEMFSVLGLLCEIHSKETDTEWDTFISQQEDEIDIKDHKSSKKKKYDNSKNLKNITGYKKSQFIPPDDVLKWSELSNIECSKIIRICSDRGFDGVIDFLENDKFEIDNSFAAEIE